MDNFDDTLVTSFRDLMIERLYGCSCRMFCFDEKGQPVRLCNKPSAVIIDPGGGLETVFCAECYKSIEKHPAYKPLEELEL